MAFPADSDRLEHVVVERLQTGHNYYTREILQHINNLVFRHEEIANLKISEKNLRSLNLTAKLQSSWTTTSFKRRVTKGRCFFIPICEKSLSIHSQSDYFISYFTKVDPCATKEQIRANCLEQIICKSMKQNHTSNIYWYICCIYNQNYNQFTVTYIPLKSVDLTLEQNENYYDICDTMYLYTTYNTSDVFGLDFSMEGGVKFFSFYFRLNWPDDYF